jgi:hypothetical protein
MFNLDIHPQLKIEHGTFTNTKQEWNNYTTFIIDNERELVSTPYI